MGYSPRGCKELDPIQESEHTAQTSRDNYKCVCAQYHRFKIHETIFGGTKRRKRHPIVTVGDFNFPLNTLRRVRQKISKDMEF